LAATSEELSGQAEQLQQAVAFFTLAPEAQPARRGSADARSGHNSSNERRAAASPMRGGAAAAPASAKKAVSNSLATGTHGNFRPY
jgi:methyl-accepting chemotaxis protein